MTEINLPLTRDGALALLTVLKQIKETRFRGNATTFTTSSELANLIAIQHMLASRLEATK